ncbi:MAG: DUF4136 domain-containing protein [Crocinitomicaceae bacterium]|nr:DUF4136 domain-containing protein [Crocinitomicaceae bacterium]
MTLKIRILFILSVIILTSCQTVQYIADYSDSQDFSPYKTYNLMEWNEANNRYVNGIDKERILKALHTEMNARGYTISNTPDLMLNVNVIIEERKGTHAYTTYMGGYYSPFGYGVTTYQEYTYLVGTLIIDMFEESSKKQVWHGAAIGNVSENNNRTDESVHLIVKRILNKYPIRPVEGK